MIDHRSIAGRNPWLSGGSADGSRRLVGWAVKRRYTTSRAAHLVVVQAYWGKRTQKQPPRVYYCKHCQGYHLSATGEIWQRRARLRRDQQRRAEQP